MARRKQPVLVAGIGINDVPGLHSNQAKAEGWPERRYYKLWAALLNIIRGLPGTTFDPRWVYLSNFIADLPEVEGFEQWWKEANNGVGEDQYVLAKKGGKLPYHYAKDTIIFTARSKAALHHLQEKPFRSVAENNPKSRLSGVGINDVFGVAGDSLDLESHKIYLVWRALIEGAQTRYKNVTVCERWHTLSNFMEDFSQIENFSLWKDNLNTGTRVQLTLKAGYKGSEYSVDTVCFMTSSDAMKKRYRKKNFKAVQLTSAATGEALTPMSINAAESFLASSPVTIKKCIEKNLPLRGYFLSYTAPTDDIQLHDGVPKYIKEGRETPKKGVSVKIHLPDGSEKVFDSIKDVADYLRVSVYVLADMLRGKSANPNKAGLSIERLEQKREYSK